MRVWTFYPPSPSLLARSGLSQLSQVLYKHGFNTATVATIATLRQAFRRWWRPPAGSSGRCPGRGSWKAGSRQAGRALHWSGEGGQTGRVAGRIEWGYLMRKSYLIALRSIKLSFESIAAQEFVFSEMKSYPKVTPICFVGLVSGRGG